MHFTMCSFTQHTQEAQTLAPLTACTSPKDKDMQD